MERFIIISTKDISDRDEFNNIVNNNLDYLNDIKTKYTHAVIDSYRSDNIMVCFNVHDNIAKDFMVYTAYDNDFHSTLAGYIIDEIKKIYI